MAAINDLSSKWLLELISLGYSGLTSKESALLKRTGSEILSRERHLLKSRHSLYHV